MSRPQSINRDDVLDAAERIVIEQGAAHLTFDAVSRAVGVTKGGVQSCFGTKEGLVAAMLRRCDEHYEHEVREGQRLEGGHGPFEDPADHVRATARSHELNARSASLLAALMNSPAQRAWTRAWYARHQASFDLHDEAGRRARLAFLATEGIFLMRYLGLAEVDQAEWDDVFADIESNLLKKAP